ncbi:MAG: YceI family protein [Ignavibacteriales bacterium]|nr:YceI family protein [Ignavibacteriales bacterium]
MNSSNILQEESVSQVQSWAIDPMHSKLQFSVRHMVISEVVGNFKSFNFKMNSSTDDFIDSEVELTIDTNSIDTGVTDRDNHLRSADFFDAQNFPEIIFKSKIFNKVDDEKYKLLGNLTIKNITKPIELDVTYGGQIVDPYGNLRAGFKVIGSLNRFDYDLKWNALIETGGAMVGKNINITCDFEIIKQKSL